MAQADEPNIYEGLDPNQLAQLRAELERYQRKLALYGKGQPPPSTETGSVGKTMKRVFWRGMENLSRIGHGAAWLPIQMLKLPGSIDEALSKPEQNLSDLVTGALGKYKPGFWGRVKTGAENVERELQSGTEFFREMAGVPKEEKWYPTTERVIPTWVPEMAGAFTQPGPYLSPIKNLLSRAAIKPALKGMAQMAPYGAAVSAMEEFNKPKELRDWWNVPKMGTAMALTAPVFQRMAGAFEKAPTPPPQAPPQAQPMLKGLPPPGPSTMPVPRPVPPGPPPPAPKQIQDFVDVPFEEVPSVIELPYFEPPKVADVVAKDRPSGIRLADLLPESLEVNRPIRDPFLIKGEAPLPAPPKALGATEADLLASMERPSLTKPTETLPDLLEVNRPPREPFLVKQPLPEQPTLAAFKEVPGVETVTRPGEVPKVSVAKTPRDQLSQELSDDLLQRVEYAKDTLGIAGQERGFQTMGEAGSSKSPTFPRYKEVTIEGGMKPHDVDVALEKIIQDKGKDKGKYVERVKQALLNDPEFVGWRKAYGQKDPIAEAEAEFALTPEEPMHPSDLPPEMLPPLEQTWPAGAPSTDDIHRLAESKGVRWDDDPDFLKFTEELTGKPKLDDLTPAERTTVFEQLEMRVPPPTIGEPPIIGREPQPGEAPLFSKAAQEAAPEQATIEWEPPAFKGGAPEAEPPLPATSPGRQAFQEVQQEVQSDADSLTKLRNLLNDERGSTQLGGGVGPIERVLTQRRFAEKHPQDFGPVYQQALNRFEWVAAQKFDLHNLGRSYFLLDQADRKIVDNFLRDRRRGLPAQINQALQPAVDAVDRMMKSSFDLINDVRSIKGMAPILQENFYVPFARSGDYLTIATAPTGQKWVSAAHTLREAEATAKRVEAQIRRQFPGSAPNVLVKTTSAKKGDLPGLDFGTMAMLEKAGFISRADFEQAVQQFDLPPGFSAHFRHAQKVLGESADLLDPIERYIDGVTNYAGRFIYDDEMKALIGQIKDPAVKQYGEVYRDYLNTKPQEYSRLRGAVAVWDLSLNIGSMIQNASQTTAMGFPLLQREVGAPSATRIYKDAWKRLLRPTPQDLAVLHMAEREGHIRPVNAEELFGARGLPGQELELGSPYLQRQMEKGWLPEQVGKPLRAGVDWLAGGLEAGMQKGGDLDLALGQKVSYAMHRLTGSSQPVAKDKARMAHPVLMQGFAAIEEMNRRWAILAGHMAGIEKGLPPDEAYEFAKTFSRNVNFDYSPTSRAQAFRGLGAPLGLFMTFQTEAMSTYSKLMREQFKNTSWRKAVGPATTALGIFWTIAGLKGLPAVEDVDLYGPSPGAMSQNFPDWVYQGPLSWLSGRDISAKFKMGPRVPYDPLHGELDLSQIPIVQPFQNVAQGTGWFLDSPMDLPSTQKYGERLLPPAARHLAQAGRWAGLGPAGEIEQGAVGTIRGHTPGPTEEGKREFFHPSATDIAAKAATFTPLELSKQYTRGRIQQRMQQENRAQTTSLVNAAADHLDRNGASVPHPALDDLRRNHPRTYKELMKAHQQRQRGVEKGSTQQIYRKQQEPKVIPR